MGDFLKITGGLITDANANNSSAGAADAGKLVKLDAGGKLDTTLMPTGVGSESRTMTTTEAVSAGALVNIWNSTGPKIRNADNSAAGKPANGFVIGAIGNGSSGTVYPEEAPITGLSGIVPGTVYFLGVAGAFTTTAPTASGAVVQEIGVGISTTEILFRPRQAITLA
jgi:hypothetical protein